jgi:hypothetical protein
MPVSYYTNSITNVLKLFQKTLKRMLTQDGLHTETKKTTDHHSNKISVMWISATYLSLKKNNLTLK